MSLCPLILLSLAGHGQTTTAPQPYGHTPFFLLFIWGTTCFACGRQVLPTDLTRQESLCTLHGPHPTSIPAPGPVTTPRPTIFTRFRQGSILLPCVEWALASELHQGQETRRQAWAKSGRGICPSSQHQLGSLTSYPGGGKMCSRGK